MRREGNLKCLEELQEPALGVNNDDLETLRIKDMEKRKKLWLKIKENLERYEEGECGKFYEDIDQDTKANFYLALLKLTATFSMNEEEFAEPEKFFTPAEIELVQRLEKYNGFDIKSSEDVVGEIRGGDRTTIDYIADYYNEMKGGWTAALNNPEIKLPVRAALKETMGKRLEVLEAGVLELIKQTGGIDGFIKETKVAQQPQQVTVNIHDSVVMRSSFDIGGSGAEQPSVRKCPKCQREPKSHEKFCPECGTGL